MISKENIKYSLKNLASRKTRSFLTIISILIGITTIFIFLSFGLGIYNYVNSFVSDTSADKITIQPRGVSVPGLDDSFVLTEEDLDAVEKTPGVYEVEGVYSTVAEVKKSGVTKFVFLLSINPEKSLITELSNFEIEKGRDLSKNDRNKVILGYNYLLDEKIFSKAIDINEKIEVNEKDFNVVGFYKAVGNPQDDSNVYISQDYFEEAFPENSEGYAMIVARVDKNNIDGVISNVEKNLRDSRDLEKGKEDFYVASFEDLLESYTSSLNVIIGFVIFIALISVIVSAINTSNTMITSVLERVKEIGVMKSIGAKNSEIFTIFLFESSVLGFVAGALGVLLGFLFTSIAENVLIGLGWSFLKPYYSFWLFFGCISFATITGAISGVIPAVNASKTSPVEALRYE